MAQSLRGSSKGKARRRVELVSHHVLRPLQGWIDHLHNLPAHGNRNLLADHLVVAHLVAFLSPALVSLRRIEEVFNHSAVQRRFGLPRVPRSTLSDAQALFDSSLLDAIITDLRQRVPRLEHDPRLDALLKTLTAVDGTFFAFAPRVAWALYNKPNTQHKPRKGNIRMDVHFNVMTGTPDQAIISDGRIPEYKTLSEHLLPDRFYVMDRGYHCYQTLADILQAGSDFLVRLRSDMQFEVIQEHPLNATQRMAGLISMQTVRVCGYRGHSALGRQSLCLVEIVQSSDSRRSSDGAAPVEERRLRLLTNRTDLDAELIGLIYRHRWQIELFFRWLKCLVNFRHFFSESENGVALQIGAAVIGTLLIALAVEDRPSSYDWAMVTHVISGLLPLDHETMEIIARRRQQRAQAQKWQKEYRARKKTAR